MDMARAGDRAAILPADADQFNSIHERLIEAWKKVGAGRHLHLTGVTDNAEDAGTLAYLEDTARQAGLKTTLLDIEAIGWRNDGGFVDLDDRKIELAFKLYPWEWMFHEAFGARLAKAATRWIEPPWKAILSNKGILPLLWEMFPDHPNLLPAYFEDDPNAARLGASFVRKPLYSREGANVALISEGVTLVEQQGPYGAEGFIRQAFAPLPNFSGQYPVIGSWLVDHAPCGLSIREDENPDHRQHVAVFAARDPVGVARRRTGRRGRTCSSLSGSGRPASTSDCHSWLIWLAHDRYVHKDIAKIARTRQSPFVDEIKGLVEPRRQMFCLTSPLRMRQRHRWRNGKPGPSPTPISAPLRRLPSARGVSSPRQRRERPGRHSVGRARAAPHRA